MLVYVFIFTLLLVVFFTSLYKVNNYGGLENHNVYSNTGISLLIAFITLIVICLITGFRAETIGNDTENYVFYFKQICEIGVTDTLVLEKGFQYFCLIIGLFTQDPHIFLIVVSVLCYGVLGKMIWKHSCNIGFSIILLFALYFSTYANILRQGIAMAIVLVAYFYLKENKLKRAILLIVFASLFHITALVALVLILYKFIPTNLKIVLPITFIFVVAGLTGTLVNVIKLFAFGYEGYFDSSRIGNGWLATTWNMIRNITFLLISSKVCRNETEKSLPLSSMVVLVWITSLGYSLDIFNRLSSYFLLISVIEIPNMLSSHYFKRRNLWMFVISIALIAFFVVSLIFRPEWNRIYPYYFW